MLYTNVTHATGRSSVWQNALSRIALADASFGIIPHGSSRLTSCQTPARSSSSSGMRFRELQLRSSSAFLAQPPLFFPVPCRSMRSVILLQVQTLNPVAGTGAVLLGIIHWTCLHAQRAFTLDFWSRSTVLVYVTQEVKTCCTP
jgi:hypothetical protein